MSLSCRPDTVGLCRVPSINATRLASMSLDLTRSTLYFPSSSSHYRLAPLVAVHRRLRPNATQCNMEHGMHQSAKDKPTILAIWCYIQLFRHCIFRALQLTNHHQTESSRSRINSQPCQRYSSLLLERPLPVACTCVCVCALWPAIIMFSTFTGNSRRPRNVNLSGQAGNPFANTSWSPAVVSNATKTVSDAQAEREKRHLERQKLKAAGKIQRTWRGHRARRNLANDRRAAFDSLYRSNTATDVAERLPVAFSLLLSFFSRRSADDIQRTFMFVRDCESAHIEHIAPRGVHMSRLRALANILITTLNVVVSGKYVYAYASQSVIF